MLLDFMYEQMIWKNSKGNAMDEVRDIKAKCLADPEQYIWRTTTVNMPEVRAIFYKIKELQFSDRPDYVFIRNQLNILLQKEGGHCVPPSIETQSSSIVLFNITSNREKECVLPLDLTILQIIS